MAKLRFLEGIKALPLLANVAVAEAATASQYIKVSGAHWATFMVSFGSAATTATTDIVTLTVECSTAGSSNATEVAVPFKYRLSSKVGTDSMGAITSAAATGVAVNMDDVSGGSSSVIFLDVDTSTLPALLTDGKYLRVVATPSGSSDTSVIAGMVAFLEPRYPGNSIASAT